MLALLPSPLEKPVIYSVVKSISGRGVRRAGRGYIDEKFLVLLHHLSNIEITKCLNYGLRFNGVFSRNNWLRINNRACLINRDDENIKVTHCVSLFIDRK